MFKKKTLVLIAVFIGGILAAKHSPWINKFVAPPACEDCACEDCACENCCKL